ncbi:MAG: hypothetical protein ACYC6T_04635 [Thermoleophilia bacterium]
MILLSTAAATLMSCGSADLSATQTTAPPATTATTSTSSTTASTEVPSTAATSSTASPTSTAPSAAGAISDADAQAVRELVTAYWEAYNAYDANRAVSYLDESYRPVKEALVRQEIGRIKAFSVTLGISEKTPPVLNGPDEAEIHLNMKEPIGTREIAMKFARHGDTWTITYSEEVK